jgi:hypothetical protein
MIPDFTSDGLLPAGLHRATLDEVHERCVGHTMLEREQLFQNLSVCLDEFLSVNLSTVVWIDGSFAQRRSDPPKDIDILLISKADHLNSFDAVRRVRFSHLLAVAQAIWKKNHKIHMCGLLGWVPQNHILRPQFEDNYNYWQDVFGNSRGVGYLSNTFKCECGPPKGIIEVVVGNPQDIPPSPY